MPYTDDTSKTVESDPPVGIAEPEALVDGAEDEADLGSRLSTAASDPPASWAGPDVPPANKKRQARLSQNEVGTPAPTDNTEPERSPTPMPENDLDERMHGLETALAVQEATMAGAEATQSAAMAGMASTNAAMQAGSSTTLAAMQAGTWSTMGAGAAALIAGIFLGIVVGRR